VLIFKVALALTMSWQTVNTVATNEQDAPQVAANRNGQVAVVWQDDRASAGHPEIYLRLWSNGTPVFEKKLSPGGTAHVQPDVGLDDRGDAVVVWADDPDGNGVHNVPYLVVSPTGTVLASGYANANAAGDQIHPRVAVDPDGVPAAPSAVAFTVVWEDVQGSAHTVKAAGFTGTATKAYEKTVSPAAGAHHTPDVGVSASGDATVVWDDGLARIARTTGAALFGQTAAWTAPAIAENFDGAFAVAWQSGDTVRERSFDASGKAGSADVDVATGTGPSVGIDDQGGVMVGWTAGSAPDTDGRLRGFNPDGTTTGRPAAQALTQVTTGRQDQYALAVTPGGQVAVAYTDDNDGNGWDQVMLGTGASDSQW
jgi:hypothetical protein